MIELNILIKNLEMVYPNGKKALDDINLEISSPNLIGLLGPNGAGKTTLMKILTTSLIQSSGEIYLDGEELIKRERYLKERIGYLPQYFGLYEELRVFQFLDYIANMKEIKKTKVEIEEVMNKTNLSILKGKKIATLSGGQKQRVGIAQAIIGNPEFLILDEPTVGLDPEERINFRNIFSEDGDNKLVILSTHIVEDIQAVCNKLIVVNNGKIIFTGSPKELLKLSKGHVGEFIENNNIIENLKITSRINTIEGIKCRAVGEILPEYANIVEPTLEEAYMYLIFKGEIKNEDI